MLEAKNDICYNICIQMVKIFLPDTSISDMTNFIIQERDNVICLSDDFLDCSIDDFQLYFTIPSYNNIWRKIISTT